VKIASVDYLRNGKNTFVRVTSADGAAGVVRTKEIEDFVPVLLPRVAPAFIGRDARELEQIVERRVADIVQPGLNYCGGIIRACRVARMARKVNMAIGRITPRPTPPPAR
jgi:L-alanine-DL-glutamate epimerase-like enolase superfamily enzyme